MRRAPLLALALHCAFTFVPGAEAAAQLPPGRPDSTKSDSARADTAVTHGRHDLMAALYALALAPAGLAPLWKDTTNLADSLLLARDHLALTLGAGLASGSDGPMLGASSTESAHLELVWRGALIAARAERYSIVSDHVYYGTVRVGRIGRPHPRVIGGVTIGYRLVPALRQHEGLEIAFPFIGGGQRSWVRLESSYVISARQSSWNYQARYERRVGTGAWTVGVAADLKSWAIRKHGRLSHGSFGVVLGRARTW